MASQMTNQSPGNWALGGRPEKHVDIPITAVFLVLFMIGAASHMTIFQLNRRRGHKFIFSVVLFGFCMARIVSCILRIASTSLPTNANLAIAAAVFVGAATLILFIINLLWSQRILRSLHPGFGWHPITSAGFKILYVLTGLTLVISITATVQSLLTVNPKIRATDRSLQLYGQTFLAVMSSLPILVVFIALIMPRRGSPDKFGSGRMSTKIIVLLAGSALVTLGAWYRCGTSWQTPVPRSRPLPGYFSKPAFYIFNFGVEVLTIYLYAIMRVDLRFHVPNGAKGPGSYEIQAQNRVGDSADTTEVDKEMQG